MENNATYSWEPEETKVSPMPPSEHQIKNSDNPPEEEFLPENEQEEDSFEDEEITETPDEEEIEDDDEVRTDEQTGDSGYDNSRQNSF